MKVRLKRTWFAPDISGVTSGKYVAANGRVIARGHRLRKGIHPNLPDAWRKLLPRDAEVLDDEAPVELEEDEREYDDVAGGQTPELDDLKQNDLARNSAEHAERLRQEAEDEKAAQLKVQQVANLAKARQAKANKKANKKENKDDA